MNRAAYAFLTMTMVFWGGNAIAGKLAVGHVSPMLLTQIRWTLACAIISLLSFRNVKRDWPAIRAHLPLLFGLGACGFAVFNAIFYTAVGYTTAINATIEQAGMPMVIFLINFLLFRMRAFPAQLLGFVLTLVGVALTASHGDIRSLAGLKINFGDALMLIAVVIYGGYTVALRFKPTLHWQSLMAALSFSAFITAIPFTIWEWTGADHRPGHAGLARRRLYRDLPGTARPGLLHTAASSSSGRTAPASSSIWCRSSGRDSPSSSSERPSRSIRPWRSCSCWAASGSRRMRAGARRRPRNDGERGVTEACARLRGCGQPCMSNSSGLADRIALLARTFSSTSPGIGSSR